MAEEEKEGEGDGEDSAALAAAGGGGGQKRTQGQKSERSRGGCGGSLQKTDCGQRLSPRSKPHKGDQRSQAEHGSKSARKGSDIEIGGVQGSKGVHGSRGGGLFAEVRSSQKSRWTRDSPGNLALSPTIICCRQIIRSRFKFVL